MAMDYVRFFPAGTILPPNVAGTGLRMANITFSKALETAVAISGRWRTRTIGGKRCRESRFS